MVMVRLRLVAVSLLAVAFSGMAAAGEFTALDVDVAALPPAMRIVGDLARTRVEERTPRSDVGRTFTVRYAVDPAVADENAIVVVSGNEARVTAGRLRGLIAGTGRLLKSFVYGRSSFAAMDGCCDFRPAKPVRIAYLARHFINPFMEFDAVRLCRYMDDLALDGINTFSFQIMMPAVDQARADDREEAEFLERSYAMVRRAGVLDCQLVGGGGSNQLPMDSDEALRAEPHRNPRAPATGFNACPAKPAAMATLLRRQSAYLDKCRDIRFDFLSHWPYDEGGCGCTNCYPWGCNGYLKMCRRYHESNRRLQPTAKTILSTWFFTDEEFAGLWKYIEQNDWIDYLLIDDFGTEYPRYPLDHPPPSKVKVITFPEISMWGREPWGAYGAIAYPHQLERIFRDCERIVSGFEYYSEGVFEDINKAVVTALYVDPSTTADAVLRRYGAYHFAGADPDDFVALANLLEANHRPPLMSHDNMEKAARLADKIDASILPGLRRSWRWRLVYLRTRIDREIERTGDLSPVSARPYFDELVRLYSAERQIDWILEGRMGGWTSPRYLPAGRRYKNHTPPKGDATETLRSLVADKQFITVRLARGEWRVSGSIELTRSRFELVLEDGCSIVGGEGASLRIRGVDGVTVRGEGRAVLNLPVEVESSQNVLVRGAEIRRGTRTSADCEAVRIDIPPVNPPRRPDDRAEAVRVTDRELEWADQHLQREKSERLREELDALRVTP